MQLWIARCASPVGEMLLVGDEAGALRALDFADYEARLHRLLGVHYGAVALKDGDAPKTTSDALDAYFSGDLTALDGLELKTGGTAFQREVWQALRQIPPGETVSYGRLAQAIGRPKASRPVGGANGANPLGIVVPCHRVIGSTGDLTGYGGGLERKRWLLAHERRHAAAWAVRNEGRRPASSSEAALWLNPARLL